MNGEVKKISNLYLKMFLYIKSIAFNAKDSPLEPFLSKKNKKRFNIAGKMNLNEWKGKKSVEFIIEDISLH